MNAHLQPTKHGPVRRLNLTHPANAEKVAHAMVMAALLPDPANPTHKDVQLQQRGPVADQRRALNRAWRFRSSLVKCKGCGSPTTYESRNLKDTEGHVFWCYTCGRKDLRVVMVEEDVVLVEMQMLARRGEVERG